MQPHRRQPTGPPHPWDSPGKNTGVGCHFLLQCMKVKSESEVAQLCPTLVTPWTAAYQAPPSMGFSRQKYWSGVPLSTQNRAVLWGNKYLAGLKTQSGNFSDNDFLYREGAMYQFYFWNIHGFALACHQKKNWDRAGQTPKGRRGITWVNWQTGRRLHCPKQSCWLLE